MKKTAVGEEAQSLISALIPVQPLSISLKPVLICLSFNSSSSFNSLFFFQFLAEYANCHRHPCTR